eukprot:5130824-Prymnesium_polylepis.2
MCVLTACGLLAARASLFTKVPSTARPSTIARPLPWLVSEASSFARYRLGRAERARLANGAELATLFGLEAAGIGESPLGARERLWSAVRALRRAQATSREQ